MEEEKIKYIILTEDITKDENLTDKEKNIYAMILALSKKQEFIMSNAYISSMLNISKVHSSRLISSLRDKGYINVKIVYKKNSKQILKRIITPINKHVNTYNQNRIRSQDEFINEKWKRGQEIPAPLLIPLRLLIFIQDCLFFKAIENERCNFIGINICNVDA